MSSTNTGVAAVATAPARFNFNIPFTERLTSALLVKMLVSGMVATGVWEVWANVAAPLWIGGPLEPTGLIKSAFGIKSTPLAHLIHFLTGFVAYPFAYLLVFRPLTKALPVPLPWHVAGALYGVGLWVFAMYGIAHFIAGFPPFLGFGQLAWASLVGHVLFGIAEAGSTRLIRQ